MIGVSAGLELHRRLADIEAVETADELSALFPELVVNRSLNERGLIFAEGYTLVFRSGHVQTPLDAAGTPDWGNITRIRLMGIEVEP